MIVLGILQGAWIAYNLFFERLPEFQEPMLPIGLTALTSGLITVGLKWMREPRTNENRKYASINYRYLSIIWHLNITKSVEQTA